MSKKRTCLDSAYAPPLTSTLNAIKMKNSALTHRSIFLKEVKEAFPEIRERINSEYGLLHCEMHDFTDHVQGLIDSGDKEEVIKAFKIAERHFLNGNCDLVNAVAVSFLEHLDFADGKYRRKWAYDLLPKSMRKTYHDLTD